MGSDYFLSLVLNSNTAIALITLVGYKFKSIHDETNNKMSLSMQL